MPNPVSAADVRRLKGDAEALRAESLRTDPESSLAQAKALDKVAQREGWGELGLAAAFDQLGRPSGRHSGDAAAGEAI